MTIREHTGAHTEREALEQRTLAQYANMPRRRSALSNNQGDMVDYTPPTRQQTRKRTRADEIDTEDGGYPPDFGEKPTRSPSSTRKAYLEPYTQPPQQQAQRRQTQAPPTKRRMPWYSWLCLALIACILGYLSVSAFMSWWQGTMDDIHYGQPRTTHLDGINFGHNGKVSNITAINDDGTIEVIEIQKPSAAGQQGYIRLYVVSILSPDDARQPIQLSAQDLLGNGKLDLLVTVKGFTIPMYNDGSTFQASPPKPAK